MIKAFVVFCPLSLSQKAGLKFASYPVPASNQSYRGIISLLF